MAVFIVLMAIDIAVASVYAKKSYPSVDVTAFWLKMLASAVFVISGGIAYAQSDKEIYGKLVLSALVFGLVGDALLSLDPYVKNSDPEKEKKNLIVVTVLGAAAFLVGHILYIVAFIKEVKIRGAFRLPVFLGVWALGMCIAVGAVFILKLKPGKIGPPILVYTAGLCAMSALSISLALFGVKDNIPLQLMLFIAPVMFMTSDATLGLKFCDDKRFGTAKMRYLTLLTYYPAQMLFSISILMIK